MLIIHSSRKVVFIDTDKIPALEERVMERVQNPSEAKMVLQLAETLIAAGVPQQELAVISIYRSQLRLISPGLRGTPDVEVATIDKYQGRDKECILVSLVRSNEQGNVSIPLLVCVCVCVIVRIRVCVYVCMCVASLLLTLFLFPDW